MRIVIIGAGKVGFSIAQLMSAEEHDVIVVESDPERGNIINERLDVQVVNGNGASPRLQEQIEIHEADLVVAVTHSDEINMMACMFAKEAGAKRTVARLRNVEYAGDKSIFENKKLGVDAFINPEQVTAEFIANFIEIPEAKNINFFDHKKLIMLELEVTENHPLVKTSLKNLDKSSPYLITAIMRNDTFIIPDGNEIFQPRDSIFVMTKTEDVLEVEKILCFNRQKVERVMILGGGRLGYYLAKLLEPTDVNVKIVEKNLKRCEFLSAVLDTTVILHGDASDVDILIEEGIRETDLIVTSTEDDKLNVLVCLLGSRLGAKKTIAQIRRSDYLPLIESVGIDVAVSPRILTREAILKYVRKGNVESLTLVDSGNAEVFDIIVSERHKKMCNQQIQNINFPRSTIIMSIDRQGEIFIPSGRDYILPGDRITIFVAKDSVKKVEKLIN